MEAKEKNGKIYLVCDDCDIQHTDLIVYRQPNQAPRILCQRCYAKRMVNWSKYDLVKNSRTDKLELANKKVINGKLRYCLTYRRRKIQGAKSIFYQNDYYEDNKLLATEFYKSEEGASFYRKQWNNGRIDIEGIKNKKKKRTKRRKPYLKRTLDCYIKQHYKTYCIALNYEKDKDMIMWLTKQTNQTNAFRELFKIAKEKEL